MSPIASQQVACGYCVEFASASGEHFDKLIALGLPVHIVPIERRLLAVSHLRSIYQLWKLMFQQQYHIVHTHTPIASFLGRLAAALARVPIVIYHMRGSFWDSPNVIMRRLFNIVEWLSGNWTSHIFTINCTDAEELVTRKIVRSEQVTCLHCGSGGVDIQRFNPERFTEADKRQIKQTMGLVNSDLVIGFIGRLVREKGIFELITAFKALIQIFPDLKLVIVGDTLSSERDQRTNTEMRQAIKLDQELISRVIFTGFREDIPELMAMMDIVVLPSHREGFGMILAEAEAMAKPVVTTDTRGGREAVRANETGFVVPIGDSIALENALMKLVMNPLLRKRMGKNGRRFAEKCFDQRAVFEKINTEYHRLLDKNGFSVPDDKSR